MIIIIIIPPPHPIIIIFSITIIIYIRITTMISIIRIAFVILFAIRIITIIMFLFFIGLVFRFAKVSIRSRHFTVSIRETKKQQNKHGRYVSFIYHLRQYMARNKAPGNPLYNLYTLLSKIYQLLSCYGLHKRFIGMTFKLAWIQESRSLLLH